MVIKISGNSIAILTEDGFELEFTAHELIKLEDQSSSKLKDLVNTTSFEVSKESDSKRKKKKLAIKPKKQRESLLEVDLHIHELTDSTKGMTNFDMLNLQLETARQQLEFAIRKRIQRVVFIHGVGEGVLKMELETLFRRYDNVKYYDANLKKYGFGATEVYIYQNKGP